MRTNPIKVALKSGKPSVGTWLSLASPIAARFLARTGFDWLTVDLEHSPVDWETAATIFALVADAGRVPLARVPAGKHDHIKRVLDNGAWGIVVPMVMDREQALMCVRAAKYPPVGNRSLGGALHAVSFETSPNAYYLKANDEILVVLQCEHIEAVSRIDSIVRVPGIDAIFVGPNDLRASMRTADGHDPSREAFEGALSRILDSCRGCGVAAGLHCFDVEDVKTRIANGWQFIALGSDLSLMLSAAQCDLTKLELEAMPKLANY
jgi:4-hydroxy-2-oxoheptanedioate aldolase